MSFAWHALPSFSCWDGLPKRTLDIAIQCKKHDWTVFITFLFPFILFSLWFASTYFTIINHPFRLPRAGAHWFTSCCSLGWSEKHKSWKMQKVGVDSKSRHSTDLRKFFKIMIGIFILRSFEQTCFTYLPFITRGKWPKWARKSTKLKHGQNRAHK